MTYIFRKNELTAKLKAEGFDDVAIQKFYDVTFNGFKRTTASATVSDALPLPQEPTLNS